MANNPNGAADGAGAPALPPGGPVPPFASSLLGEDFTASEMAQLAGTEPAGEGAGSAGQPDGASTGPDEGTGPTPAS